MATHVDGAARSAMISPIVYVKHASHAVRRVDEAFGRELL
jgi:hypothetical protein